MLSIITILRDVPDPRRGNATRHDLLEVLTIALVASICGCESCVEFADFAEDREELFREFLSLDNGLPSHDTFSRVSRLLDPEAFAACFGRFLAALGADGGGVIAIDGKTLRRSFDRAAERSPLHVVAAFGCETRLALAQRSVASGENEIVAARALLETMTLEGVVVTADAMHCQAETARVIRARGGDYLFALKDNRPTMRREGTAYFEGRGAGRGFETVDAEHGRLETRRHRVSHDVGWLFSDRRYPDEPAMPDLVSIGCVDSETVRDGKITRSTRYYLSSVALTPERLATLARSHWRIENGLHWGLDMVFDEDRARNRKDNAPANLAVLRKLALNVLRTARPTISIRRKRKRSGWSDAFARSVLGQMR